jgi:hypothetical protein
MNTQNEPIEGMVVVAQYEGKTEAELACGLLVSAGFAATLDEREVFHGVSESLPLEALIGVMVPEAEVEQARQLLAEAQRSGGTTAEDVAEAIEEPPTDGAVV